MTTIFNCSSSFILYGTFDILSVLSSALLCFQFSHNFICCFSFLSPSLPLHPLFFSQSSLHRGIELLAIHVADTALIRYSLSLSPPLDSLILTLPLAFPNVLTQASFLAVNQAPYFSDCCCTSEKKKKKTCVMIVCCSFC